MLYLYAVLCVIGLSVGQILFKMGAAALSSGAVFFSIRVQAPILGAMAIYGVTSIAWVYILRNIELGRIYPIMALAFIVVPLGSYFVFGEKFNAQYVIGLVLIVLGIVVVTRS